MIGENKAEKYNVVNEQGTIQNNIGRQRHVTQPLLVDQGKYLFSSN